MNRRNFIQNSIGGVVLPTVVSGINVNAFGSTGRQEKIGDDRVLVLIQLAGGNDGLNTVIPLDKYSLYQNARKNIAIPEDKAIKILGQDKVGLNPAMTGLAELFKDGKAALVQSVGYPNFNYSHFRATDIWHSSPQKTEEFVSSGWTGRYLNFDNPSYPEGYPNTKKPDPLAIQLGSTVSTVLQGPISNFGIAISNPASFYSIITGKVTPTPNTLAGNKLTFLKQMANSTNKYASNIKQAASNVNNLATYPTNNSLADQLKIIARLIAGGLQTKVYTVTLGGFDTHSDQVSLTDFTVGNHATLLGRVSGAIKSFMDDLKALGVSERVLGMTYSEFGRRIKSNDSRGTDHGAAAPLFLFGDSVNPIIVGNTPSIPANPTSNDQVGLQNDFRQVYTSVLKDWLCVDSADLQAMVPGSFQALPLIKDTACKVTLSTEPVQVNKKLFYNYPNPASDHTMFKFYSEGGFVQIDVLDSMGREVAYPTNDTYEIGYHEVYFGMGNLLPGLYYARMIHNEKQQVVKVIKK
ncbi:MAG: DUF1501 domain-containing protein [Leadbetterella sp.]